MIIEFINSFVSFMAGAAYMSYRLKSKPVLHRSPGLYGHWYTWEHPASERGNCDTCTGASNALFPEPQQDAKEI